LNSTINNAILSTGRSTKMKIITANEIKKKGVSIIEESSIKGEEVIISIHGKNRYVIMDIETYHHLRECELEAAINQVKEEIKAGKYYKESIEDHLNRIKK
jgi:PHD/YefM family antitoxin component YafN of YafNO toxin-antitoxin module